MIRITYKIQERRVWRIAHALDVDPTDPSKVKRVAVKYMRKRIRLFDSELNILTPRDCFESAIADGKDTILMIPEDEIDISEELETSATKLRSHEDSSDQARTKKRGRR